MKKIIALFLVMVLSAAVMVPVDALVIDENTYMIWDAESSTNLTALNGSEISYDRLAPAKVMNSDHYLRCPYYHGHDGNIVPEAKEGNNVCWFHPIVSNDYRNGFIYDITKDREGNYLDATYFNYIEFDIYSHIDTLFDFRIALCPTETAIDGASWNNLVGEYNQPEELGIWLRANEWTHVKIPFSEFSDFPEEYTDASMASIKRIRFESLQTPYALYPYISLDISNDTSDWDRDNTVRCIFVDNFIATTTSDEEVGYTTEEDFRKLMNKEDSAKDKEEYILSARENYYTWQGIEDPELAPVLVLMLYGDLDGNKRIEASDALDALQHSVGKIELTGDNLLLADVNDDGEVTSSDALYILQYSVGKIDSFPRESQYMEKYV